MALDDDVALWSTTRQAAAIRGREFTSRELLELYIGRIERINPTINAVVTLQLDEARAAADAADARLAAGTLDGPLHGIPVTIKDALETRGMRSTGGAVELRDHVPDRDAPVVRAVKAAGAIVFGKTNLPRWSGDIQSYNEMFGTTNNPWDVSRVPGGSSGGAAAFGVVPSTGYLDHAQGGDTEADINVIGPLARSAEDLALLMDLLQRRDGPLVANLPPAPEDIASLRVAAWLDDPFCPVDAEVLEVLNRATDALQASGVSVDRNARPDIDPAHASGLGMWLVTAALAQSMPNEDLEDVPTAASGPVSHRAWLDADRERQHIRHRWARFFEDYDAILMPISFVPPFPHQQAGNFGNRTLQCNGQTRPYADLVKWTILTGMAYLPASVPPIGLTRSGVPTSFQVVGAHGRDRTTMALAGRIADLNGGFRPPLD